MDRVSAGRLALAVDAVGCAGTAFALAVAPATFRPVDPSGRARGGVLAGLIGTALVCGLGTRSNAPSRGALTSAALVNAGWVAVCLVTASSRPSRTGRALVATTAIADAVVGVAQWALRPQAGTTGTSLRS